MLRKFKVFLTAFAVSICFSTASASSEEELPSFRELLHLYADSNGGLLNINTLTSIIAYGKVMTPSGPPRDFTLYLKKPHRMHIKFRDEKSTHSRIFNGKEGYEIRENERGEIQVAPILGKQLDLLRRDAFIDSSFFRLREQSEHIVVAGLSEVNGEPAYELLIGEGADSDLERMWIHQEHLYELKQIRMVQNDQGDVVQEEFLLSDFVAVRGVWMAKSIETYLNEELVQTISIDRIRANAGVYDSFFDKPKF